MTNTDKIRNLISQGENTRLQLKRFVDDAYNAPVRLFIFDNRIELHSPGILPDSVTEENIKEGISVPRNKLLFDNAKFLLPYTGIGSGIMRVLQSYDKISFKNNFLTEEFVITMTRDEVAEDESCGINDLVSDPLNDLVNDPLKSEILDLIKSKPNINYNELAVKIGVSTATIKRHIQQLKSKGIIERFGSDKTGEYRIICKTKNNGVQYRP